MTHCITLLYEQSFVSIVKFNFMINDLKVVKEKTSLFQPCSCILHFDKKVTSDIYHSFIIPLSQNELLPACNENK